jgi:enamine deaminase RidA (YjgF/YER057c/UK114 family)
MIRHISTSDAPPPFSNYSQAVEVPPGYRLICISGQVGVDTSGNLAAGERAQHEQTWRNILAILASQGLGPADIVEVTAYVTSQSGVPIYREVRDGFLKGARPASTLLIISGLADPAWCVEIAVTAAAPVS